MLLNKITEFTFTPHKSQRGNSKELQRETMIIGLWWMVNRNINLSLIKMVNKFKNKLHIITYKL